MALLKGQLGCSLVTNCVRCLERQKVLNCAVKLEALLNWSCFLDKVHGGGNETLSDSQVHTVPNIELVKSSTRVAASIYQKQFGKVRFLTLVPGHCNFMCLRMLHALSGDLPYFEGGLICAKSKYSAIL